METLDPFRAPTLFDGDDTAAPDGDHPCGLPDYLEDQVPELFRTWNGEGEQLWADFAFKALRRAGVAHDGRDLDGVRNAMVFATLAALTRQFYVHAWGEGDDGDWVYQTQYLDSGYPEVNLIDLGRLAEREGVAATDSGYDPSHLAASLVQSFVRSLAPDVAAALESELGISELFVSLWAVRSADVEYPLLDDHEAWDVLAAPDADVMSGYEWITNGMPL